MSRLTRKMKTNVTKAVQSCGVNSNTVSKGKINREFLGGGVAGFVRWKRVHRPELIRALFSREWLQTSYCPLGSNFTALLPWDFYGDRLHALLNLVQL